jgi:hypothetical protein
MTAQHIAIVLAFAIPGLAIVAILMCFARIATRGLDNCTIPRGYGEYDGTSGQDRESYSDDQDRDTYVPDDWLD